jgi:hypothetical protein
VDLRFEVQIFDLSVIFHDCAFDDGGVLGLQVEVIEKQW